MDWMKQPDSEGYYWVSYAPGLDIRLVLVWRGTDNRYRLRLLGLSPYLHSSHSPEFKEEWDNTHCCDNYPEALWIKQEPPALPQ